MRLQVTHRVAYALLDRDPRLPAQRLQLARVEMHKGCIAEPAALAAGGAVSNTLKSELLDNDVGKIEHVHEFVVAEIEDVLALCRVLHSIEDPVHSVCHLEIRFAL